MYELMGLHDAPISCCAALDTQGYIDIATRLATNRTYRAAVSVALRRRRHVLFENQGVIREWEEFIWRAVRQARERR
jgi:hypothetical protein